MSSAISNPAVWSFGLALLTYAGLAALLIRAKRGGSGAVALAFALCAGAIWSIVSITATLDPVPHWWAAWHALDVLRLAAWSGFLVAILAEQVSRNLTARMQHAGANDVSLPRLWQVLHAEAVLALIVVVVAAGALVATSSLMLAKSASFDKAVIGASLLLSVLGLACVELLVRRTRSGHRWGIGPLALGLAGMFAFDLYAYADALMFAKLDLTTWSALGVVQATATVLIGVAMLRDRQWTVQFAVSHRLVFHSTTIFVAGVYLALVAAAGYYTRWFGGSWGAAMQAALFFVMLVLLAALALSGRMRAKLRVLVGKHLFSHRYDYREEWLRVTRTLSNPEHADRDVHRRAIHALADLVESPAGALWIRRERGFEPAACCNTRQPDQVMGSDDALVQFLDATGWVIDVREARTHAERYHHLALPHWLADWAAARLIVPLSTGEELTGFVVLAEPRVRVEFDWEVRDLLKTAARQAASYVAQAEASAALVEAEKFAAFSRMSAFVVHDLKNLVAQLSLMSKNAERHRSNPEFQDDMLATVRNVTERMNGLVRELRVEEQPITNAGALELGPLVQRLCGAWSHARQGLECVVARGVFVQAHAQRLERVLDHVIKNAVEATSAGDTITVRAFSDAGQAVIVVEDEGVGMTREFMKERLFKPFQTTKADGTGIGMYESERYIASLGGRVEVESAIGGGTRVTIRLQQHQPIPTIERAAA